MLKFLFLLLLFHIAALDWRSKKFEFTLLLPMIILILVFHPENISLCCVYILTLMINHWMQEKFIGNGDIDILWIGYCVTGLQMWSEWLLLACICQYLLQFCYMTPAQTAPFVPSLATSWLIICAGYL